MTSGQTSMSRSNSQLYWLLAYSTQCAVREGPMLKDLNWRPLDKRRIDSRLLMIYKVTHDLVAIPAPEYLVRNTRQYRHIYLWPIDRSIHSKTITDSHFLPGLSSTGMPSLPIYQISLPWLSLAMQCLPGDPCVSLNTDL